MKREELPENWRWRVETVKGEAVLSEKWLKEHEGKDVVMSRRNFEAYCEKVRWLCEVIGALE